MPLKLSDFEYDGTAFPAAPTPVTADSSALRTTISIIATILARHRFDQALDFLLDHKVMCPARAPRMPSPRLASQLTATDGRSIV